MIRSLTKSETDIIKAQQYIQNIYIITKELLENAIDANATNIVLTITDSSIVVKDDGDGIADLSLLFKEGCTSKKESTDHVLGTKTINKVTYGFRGQALSAISSISDIEIITKHTKAYKINNTDRIARPAAREKGTTVKVENIFKNCEIRRKIYNKESQKYIPKILKLIKMYSLVNEIRFTFNHKKKTWFENGMSNIRDKIDLTCTSYTLSNIYYDLYLVKDCKYANYMYFHKRPVAIRSIDKTITAALAKYNESKYSYILILKCKGDVNVEIDKTDVILYNENEILLDLRNNIDRVFIERQKTNEKPASVLSQKTENILASKNTLKKYANKLSEPKLNDTIPFEENKSAYCEIELRSENDSKKVKCNDTHVKPTQNTDGNIIVKNSKADTTLDYYENVFSNGYEPEDFVFTNVEQNYEQDDTMINISNFTAVPNKLTNNIEITKADFEKMHIIGQFNNGFILQN